MVYQCLSKSFFRQLATLAKYGYDFGNEKERCKNVINKEDYDMEIPALFWACQENEGHLVEQLIRCGCNADYKNRYEETAAHHAAMYGSLTCLKLLWNTKAHLNHVDNLGNTPFDKAKEYKHKECAELLSEAQKYEHKKGLSQDIALLVDLALT